MNGEFSENKIWHFIDSGAKTGVYNMGFDLSLVERCRETGDSFLRFYKWQPYAISLGYNQLRLSGGIKINTDKCAADGIDVVERPTGGRAVLHSHELTYSVVMKTNRQIRDTYRDISVAIVNGLKLIEPANKRLEELSFTKETPDLLKLIKTGMYNLCFNSQIKNEINFRGRKLVGSAQRKFGDVILQHGSILIGEHHKTITDYLTATEEQKAELHKEINEKTSCLNEILNREVNYAETAKALFKGFESSYNIKFATINRLADLIAERAIHHESILN